MPSHTAASALVKLYGLGDAPWAWPTWQEITGIKHGLFPTDDRHLPIGWSRRDADDVKSYFLQYQQLATEEQKIKFSVSGKGGSASVPGRKTWSDFVSRFWPKWNIHGKIVECLTKCGVHPTLILEQENSLDIWPNAETYIPIALDSIALVVFGREAFNDSDFLSFQLRKCLTIFVQRSWSRIRQQMVADKKKLPVIEFAALNAFQGMRSSR